MNWRLFSELAAGDGDERGIARVADGLPVFASDEGGAENAPAAVSGGLMRGGVRRRAECWSDGEDRARGGKLEA